MTDERDGGDDVHERVLWRMVAALPEAERTPVLLRLLDEIERLHRESGAEVPPWIDRVRTRVRGEAK